MAKILTLEDFINRSNEIHNKKYDYSKTIYKNSYTKVCIICPEHGEFWQTPNHHLQRRGCPKCAQILKNKKKTITQEEFEKKANNIHNGKYKYCNDYKNDSTKICIICPEHGEFWQTPNHHLQGEGCPKCAVKKNVQKQKLTQEEFKDRANIVHNHFYTYEKSNYTNYKTELCITCPIHGEFWQTPEIHLNGHGCPKCGKQISKGEIEIKDFLKQNTNLEIIERNKNIISPYEIVLYIPSKKIAIEYDGLIWHSEKFGKDKHYHLNKTELCEKQGIRLIHIFEDEWLYKRDIVKAKLLHILGNNNQEKIFARKCKVNEIKNDDASNFLNKNHIQGKCNASVYLGCFYEDKLIGVMLFKKMDKETNYELVRFATDINKNCIGVASKMFKYFIRNYSFKRIKTFADRRWSVDYNNVYLKMNFSLSDITKPNYSYVDETRKKRIHKFLCRKNRLLSKYNNNELESNMTETEMCEKIGLYKIWDCGLYKYVYKKE